MLKTTQAETKIAKSKLEKLNIMYAYHDLDESISQFCQAFGFELKAKIEFENSPLVYCKLKSGKCIMEVCFKKIENNDNSASEINAVDELLAA